VELPDFGDFSIGDLTIEVGGKGKGDSQVKNQKEYLVAADDIEIGFGKKIPIWLFGFLY
jgi:hypothetical protein